jgi:hypothetical protein
MADAPIVKQVIPEPYPQSEKQSPAFSVEHGFDAEHLVADKIAKGDLGARGLPAPVALPSGPTPFANLKKGR